ncbi:unnamed protein product [Brassica napus]|uniref:Uncharacterized protein n=2 Tax=Brassica TaxID=3705 RepID=A0A0D3AZN6_BRAOL|nr:unnamed protein product [Brassica napus]
MKQHTTNISSSVQNDSSLKSFSSVLLELTTRCIAPKPTDQKHITPSHTTNFIRFQKHGEKISAKNWVPTSALGLKVSGRNGNLATGQLRCGLGLSRRRCYKVFGM